MESEQALTAQPSNGLTVEVWSDIMCPFCYLGKQRFAEALSQFPHRDEVTVVWKSFQLMPQLKTEPGISITQLLAREKGIDPQQARAMNARIARAGQDIGLAYDFDRIVVANTFNAQRLLQLAGAHGKQEAAADRLFRAYFSEGRNVDDAAVLVELGAEIGLAPDEVSRMLGGDDYSDAVRADIAEARELGVSGVPFFVLDRKYAVSGAQESLVFLEALTEAYGDRLTTPDSSER